MKITPFLPALFVFAGSVSGAVQLFDDTFDDGDTAHWEFENCSLAVSNEGDHYIHGYSTYDTACHIASLTRNFATSGWVMFEADVHSSWPVGLKGFPGLVYSDAGRTDTTTYGHSPQYVHQFVSTTNAITFTQGCFTSMTYSTALYRLRAVLLEDRDRLGFDQYFVAPAVDSSASTVTYEGIPANDRFIFVVHVRSDHVWEISAIDIDGGGMPGTIDPDLAGNLNEHSWISPPVAAESSRVAFTLHFSGEPRLLSSDELTVFSYDPGSVSTVRHVSPPARRPRNFSRLRDGRVESYDPAGRAVTGLRKGLLIQRIDGQVRRAVRMW
jgi:hypothetical protein